MVEAIYQHEASRNKSTTKAIEAAIGGLKFQRSIVESNPFGAIDIEELYESLVSLANRHTNFLAPFVGSWSHAVASVERPDIWNAADSISRAICGAVESYSEKLIRDLQKSGRSGSRLNHTELASVLVRGLSLTAGEGQYVFENAAASVLGELKRLSWIQSEHQVRYIEPMLKSASIKPLWIASLNYDNAIELAAKNQGLSIDLGLRNNESYIRFEKESNLCLAKLHGSVNWSYDDKRQLRVDDQPSAEAILIFGSGNKLRVDGPYLDLMFAFRTQLETSDELHVCGYSFRDQHINHIVVNWLESKQDRVIFVFDPVLTSEDLARNVAKSMPRGWWIRHNSFAPRVRVEPLSASEWIAAHF
jgi:hypothetical protein